MSTVDITPTVDSVAQILRARTKDDQGQELGTFTAATRPTDVQVSGLIATAQADVIAQTGPLLGVLTQEAARSAVAMRTAMLVELSYFPEQVRNDRSAYPEYERLYNASMAALMASINAGGSGFDQFPFTSLPVRSATTATQHTFMGGDL
jgi:hypothetical protein